MRVGALLAGRSLLLLLLAGGGVKVRAGGVGRVSAGGGDCLRSVLDEERGAGCEDLNCRLGCVLRVSVDRRSLDEGVVDRKTLVGAGVTDPWRPFILPGRTPLLLLEPEL